jgi:hypothetical protein
MKLYATDATEPRIKFQKNMTGISSIAWLDSISGDLITSTSKVGALKVWNAANIESKDMIKVGPQGIKTIVPLIGHSGVFLL